MANMIATKDSFANFLVEYGKTHKDAIVMSADVAASTQTKKFADAYPDRFINVGIAEQNMMGMANGIAHSGKTVFVSAFALFATGRAYEIIRNSIAYTHGNVKICCPHAGLMSGEDGVTHQSVEDLALMNVIPEMTVVYPADDVAARKLLPQIAEMDGPAYVRLGRVETPVVYKESQKFTLGKATKLREGKDATIIATGSMVATAIEAADILAKQSINVRVLDMHTIKPIDKKAIIAAAKETGAIITAEEHSMFGGLGSIVSGIVCENYPCKMKMIAIRDSFGRTGKYKDLLVRYGLSAKDIVKAVKSCL